MAGPDRAPSGGLEGLGPRSREMMARVGVHTREDLATLGAVEAYRRAKAVVPGVSLNLLWGLQALLTGLPWQEVARLQREALLAALAAGPNPAPGHRARARAPRR